MSVDGPLAGTADTTTYRYDADRARTGAILLDPDGAGALKRRAVQTSASYDANARRTKDVLTAGGTTYGVTQYSHDAVGRLECSAQRLDSATWGSLPASACSLGTTGGFGPDRIARATVDAAGRTTRLQTAYGTADQADEASGSYNANDTLATLTDAEGNKTSYEYDGFDRLAKTRYPVTTAGSGSSSTSDYEQLGHDANGSVTSRRLRDGQSIGYSYDALGRQL